MHYAFPRWPQSGGCLSWVFGAVWEEEEEMSSLLAQPLEGALVRRQLVLCVQRADVGYK